MHRPLVIAHRGASAYEPENTMAAFRRAIALGADMIELDVRRSQDGVLVIHHDADLEGQAIATLTWNEIQAIAPQVPTLDAVIALCKGKILLDVELKETGYEPEVTQCLLRQLPIEAFVVTSFNASTVEWIKLHSPAIATGYLIETSTVEPFSTPEDWIAKTLQLGADFIAPDWQMVDGAFAQAAQLCELPLWVWTVNDEVPMAHLLQLDPIAAIITNYPDRGLRLRQSQAGAIASQPATVHH
ncbi:MAG TPA: glycerophosphodiester phosphodiesterase [Chroococcidiopsis sp.]